MNITSEITRIPISEFLNKDLKNYAMYVLKTRALPSAMDGMRVGARKILWAGINGRLKKRNAEIKMPTFIGESMSYHYNHGDVSIKNTIEQLSSVNVFEYAPFNITGQIETLRSGKVNTAARYLSIESNNNIDLFTKDLELVEHQTDEGDKIEPKYLLPIIPMLLLYRTNSPGFGFSYRCMSYSIDSVIDNCIQAISRGTCNDGLYYIPLQPKISDLSGIGIKPENLIYNYNRQIWYNVGEYTIREEHDEMIITDLPYIVNLPKYDEHLHELCDKQVIKSFQDFSMDGQIKYLIKFYAGGIRKLYNKNPLEFFKKFKLVTSIPPDIINVIEKNQQTILFFDDAYQYIDYFVKERLKIYDKRKTLTIKVLEEKINQLSEIIRFIEYVIKGELEIRNVAVNIIEKFLTGKKIPISVLKIPVSKLTKEEIEKHYQEINELQIQLDYIKRTSIDTMYLSELIELKRKYCEVETVII
jgi:DNA topoisomerase-2